MPGKDFARAGKTKGSPYYDEQARAEDAEPFRTVREVARRLGVSTECRQVMTF